NLNIQIYFYESILERILVAINVSEKNLFIYYLGLCFIILIFIPFLNKKNQNIGWCILLVLLLGNYIHVIVGMVIFDIILYYGARFISNKRNIKIKEIKNILFFQYFSKLFPLVGFLSFLRLGLSNNIEIKKLLKISLLSSVYSFLFIFFTFLSVFVVGDILNNIHNTRDYEVLVIWWQFIIVGIYAMGMYFSGVKKGKI
ncbi:MAG: hypothetical protein GY828_08365, partial [Candidatus Gracilibacteria bacterium]|nr:hypothetical protein [Candidatus Gracilibacteria bacterium]